MSDESEEEVYEETTTEATDAAIGGDGVEPEAEAPSPAPGVAPLADWVEELLGRLAAGDRLSASDTARVPYATQLQGQYAARQLQAQAAAAQAATDRAARVTAGQHQRELVAELRKQGSEHRQEITALRRELDEVRRGKEEDAEPGHREYVERDSKNPFGGPGTIREGEELEPTFRTYPNETAYKHVEKRGGKDLINYRCINSTAEALWDLRAKLATLLPFVCEQKLNPERKEDLSEEAKIELEFCKCYNTLGAIYDNIINPQLSYLQLEACLKSRYTNTSDAGWVGQGKGGVLWLESVTRVG
jgi:hypothetical protein